MKWGIGAAGSLAAGALTVMADDRVDRRPALPAASWKKLPLWYGFNLMELFMQPHMKPYQESDFEWMAEWGFNFVRLPMDYRAWTDPKDPFAYDEKVLGYIDKAVAWGKEYRIHVCLNLHRAPGYTVAHPKEKLLLWESDEAQRRFDAQWAMFAKRYREYSSRQVSFDLVNEPAGVSAEKYAAVVKRVTQAIRREDPERLIIADGRQWGRDPVPELIPYRVAQSTRGYDPFGLTHYRAKWVDSNGTWPKPTWPMIVHDQTHGKAWLEKNRIAPWKKLQQQGVGVHVGEWGCYNKTPYDVTLHWMKDILSLWHDAGWGWALWNLRGPFGIIDSKRKDAKYESFHGHRLDRRMLELLQKMRK
jgi:endoglucanase